VLPPGNTFLNFSKTAHIYLDVIVRELAAEDSWRGHEIWLHHLSANKILR